MVHCLPWLTFEDSVLSEPSGGSATSHYILIFLNFKAFKTDALISPSVFTIVVAIVQFSSFQSLSCVQLFATPWIAARQASLSITNSQSLPKLTPIESVMPSSHIILCRPLLLLPPIPPSIRVFSSESTLCMRWPEYWSFSFSISSCHC